MTDAGVDPNEVSPEQFAALVASSKDRDIEERIHEIGTERTLDRVFAGFEERFVPERARGVDADVQFVVEDGGDRHRYVVAIHDGECRTERGEAESPKTTLTAGLVPFVKLMTGNADGMKLFMTRKLKVSGDLMFAQRLLTFFDRPGA